MIKYEKYIIFFSFYCEMRSKFSQPANMKCLSLNSFSLKRILNKSSITIFAQPFPCQLAPSEQQKKPLYFKILHPERLVNMIWNSFLINFVQATIIPLLVSASLRMFTFALESVRRYNSFHSFVCSFIPAGWTNHVRYRPRSGCQRDERMRSHSQTYYITKRPSEIIWLLRASQQPDFKKVHMGNCWMLHIRM